MMPSRYWSPHLLVLGPNQVLGHQDKTKWGKSRKHQNPTKYCGGRRCQSSKCENYKQGRVIVAVVYKSIQPLSKKKNGEAVEATSKTFIMSLIKDEDIKKTITTSILLAKVKETKSKSALSLEEQARQAVKVKKKLVSKKLNSTLPYAVPKRNLSTSDVLQHSLKFSKNKTSGI
eukprot:9289026-Ditylum_brightwellii.AAC.1